MFDLKTINLSFFALAHSENALLTGVKEDYRYENNKRVEQIGTRYEVVLPQNKYQQINVKTTHFSPIVSNEEITAAGGAIPVRLKNFSASIYRIDNNYGVTCKADDVEIVKAGKAV